MTKAAARLWQDSAEYAAPTGLTGAAAIAAANKECADKVPSGGVVLVPPPEPGQYALGTYTATPGAASSRRLHGFKPFLQPADGTAGKKGTIFLTVFDLQHQRQ